jgi:hypothetical protein
MAVIDIGEFRLTRGAPKPRSESCQHNRLTLDDNGEIVTCDDCVKQVGAYFALRMLVERWDEIRAKTARRQQAADEALGKTVGLRAAQKVERAWRSRTMVPTCPHCNEAIFAEDGFGGSAVNRAIALRRRGAKDHP